ncbi:phosphotransferase [Vibrio sp. 10N.261.46.E12]|uniref:phosphotransferase n=1 Tax=unclassified Vibrio TaxID=2614977 RepID=UPI000975B1B7|nr:MULTISPECIES: phosphotransferase [unclassified Vibrio]OMO34731.1 choline kinase [Vibrio sp. 10N.261.45.E1]PMJ24987.1 choline kinase [Vibrio sp. 10N.286.45.B6]PML95485.1 choline kinase [Vibrio sp. 10N.261.49.E11]PMM64245.1 choline kinase [Vibrio sp. 10N.261.46.F12]PMM85278.1 choline kinase [Vibrio sp. 10N.261.46.E8]
MSQSIPSKNLAQPQASSSQNQPELYQKIATSLGCNQKFDVQVIQRLWGGYGELVRLVFSQESSAELKSVIVKHVALPDKAEHPKGWNTKLSHQRKVHSYQVETAWYQSFTQQWDDRCPVPVGLQCELQENEWLIVMQDLADIGFPLTSQFDVLAASDESVVKDTQPRYTSVEIKQHNACLKWLAHFHAKHIHIDKEQSTPLWPVGTYWHLDTRPDELNALADLPLKNQAKNIDRLLRECPYQTLVHGDAKLANFCFDSKSENAAAVDFQYVGHGCAMKDVALFMSSAIRPQDCTELESQVLDTYFKHLKEALVHYQPQLSFDDVEKAWRPMFYVAWADFQRFVKGWSPEHWKINPYTEQLTLRVLTQLDEQESVNVR